MKNLIGRAYLAKIASDTQKKASECSRFSNEANEIGAETQQDNESTMQRIARMLGCEFLYPWKSIQGDRMSNHKKNDKLLSGGLAHRLPKSIELSLLGADTVGTSKIGTITRRYGGK